MSANIGGPDMILVHRVMGPVRIAEICGQYGLGQTDRQIIDQILERWEKLLGKPLDKLQVAIELTECNKNRGKIFQATNEICAEFAAKQLAQQQPSSSQN